MSLNLQFFNRACLPPDCFQKSISPFLHVSLRVVGKHSNFGTASYNILTNPLLTMRKTALLAALFVAFISIQAIAPINRSQQTTNYISTYLNLASFESARSGIPVSIILAQGILESQCGNSKLAQIGNNHFGIKWNSTADGDFITQYDDDKDKKGNRVPSRFIKYSTAEESYRHHSDFLMNRERYKNLFKLGRTDYRGWAKGLSACHYASDPQYANKLIYMIENSRLNELDIPEVLTLDDEENDDIEIVDYNAPALKRDVQPVQAVRYSQAETENNSNVSENDNDSENVLFEIGIWESKNPSTQKKENKLYEITPDSAPKKSNPKQPIKKKAHNYSKKKINKNY